MPDFSELAYGLAGYGKKPSPYDAYRKFGLQQLQQGSDASPVQSPWQGAARLAQSLAGVYGLYQADQGEKEAQNKLAQQMAEAGKITDPTERVNAYTKIDPEVGMKGGIQLAIEQAKLQQQTAALKTGAANFGSAYGAPQGPQQASGPPTPLGPLPTGSVPAGNFANNSGNIRSTAPGNANGFATYPTPQAGANAHFQNYQAYVQQNPNITVAQALAKWSPPNENDTNGIVSRLAEETGINPGMPLAEVLKDPMVAARLLDAQTRLEKGGMPQGFNADTFIAAAGGQPQPGAPAPGVPGPVAQPPQGQQIAQAPPLMAQGGGDGTPPQPNPAGISGPAVVAPAPPGVPDVPRPQPSQQQLQQYQQRIQSGEFGIGPEAISKARSALDADLDRQWQVDRERAKAGYDQKFEDYKHQRGIQDKKDNPQYTQEQNLAHTYATRLNNSIPQLEALARDPSKIPSWAEQMNAISPYYPEPMVSDKAKEFRRVAKDIMSATLRRESGASIHADEYTTEAQKFIPQPGDSPEIVANKIASLKQAARSIAEGTGRPVESYSFFGGAPAAGAGAAPAQGGGVPPPPPGFQVVR